MIPNPTAKAHIIHLTTGEMLSMRRLHGHAPRIGEEIRLSGPRYFKVKVVIWVYDEPECPLERVNIGVIEADVKDKS